MRPAARASPHSGSRPPYRPRGASGRPDTDVVARLHAVTAWRLVFVSRTWLGAPVTSWLTVTGISGAYTAPASTKATSRGWHAHLERGSKRAFQHEFANSES